MKRALLLSTLISLAIPAGAQVDPEIHSLCLDAKDYSGCVQTQTSLSSKTEAVPKDSTGTEPIESTAWHKHLSENPDLKKWVEANPALGEARKKKWLSENEASEDDSECPKDCYFSPTYNQCSYYDNRETGGKVVPCSEKSEYQKRRRQLATTCPPGKKLYLMEYLGGLIKGKEACLTDYERMSLDNEHRRQWGDAMQGIQDGINSFPR